MTSHHPLRVPLLSFALGVSCIAATAAPLPYRLVDIAPGYGWGLNDRGDIAGQVDVAGEVQLHAAVWRDGILEVLSDGGLGLGSAANAIAPDGTAVGWFTAADGSTQAVKWSPDGTRTALGVTGAAVGINARGTILGFDNPGLPLGWVIGADGHYRILPPKIPGETAVANAINDHDWIVGDEYSARNPGRCVVWHDGQVQELGFPPGGATYCAATAINNLGHIAGFVGHANGTDSAFLWREGTWTLLGTLGGDNSDASYVNDNDVVVGWSSVERGHRREQPFVWQDGTMTDLTVAFKDHFQVNLVYLQGIDAKGHILMGVNPKAGGYEDYQVEVLVPVAAK
jgi:probable HAF family extracellular repeat protein